MQENSFVKLENIVYEQGGLGDGLGLFGLLGYVADIDLLNHLLEVGIQRVFRIIRHFATILASKGQLDHIRIWEHLQKEICPGQVILPRLWILHPVLSKIRRELLSENAVQKIDQDGVGELVVSHHGTHSSFDIEICLHETSHEGRHRDLHALDLLRGDQHQGELEKGEPFSAT